MIRERLIDSMPGRIIEVLDKKSLWKKEREWFSAYCGALKKATGKWSKGEFRWHVFSYGYYPCVDDAEALDEYSRQKALLFYVVPEIKIWPLETAFVTDQLPPKELVNQRMDFYVFPKNLAWTMAFTHEYGWLGPYFAKHQAYEKLNMKNIRAVEAKAKGW